MLMRRIASKLIRPQHTQRVLAMSTAAPELKIYTPPTPDMESNPCKRFAKSAYDVAVDEGMLPQIVKDMDFLNSITAKNQTSLGPLFAAAENGAQRQWMVAEIINELDGKNAASFNPVDEGVEGTSDDYKKFWGEHTAEQESLLKDLRTKSKPMVTPTFRDLFIMAGEENLVGRFDEVHDAFLEYTKFQSKLVDVQVTSAQKLTKSQLKKVHDKMQKHVPAGWKLDVTNTVQPELLGGFRVIIGDMMQDLTVSSRLQTISNELRQASV